MATSTVTVRRHNEPGFSGLAAVPITMARRVPEDLDRAIKNPGAPRANITVDAEHPEGTYTAPNDLTVLQQHMKFWDPQEKGIIYPIDTYRGFRQLGFDPFLSFVAPCIINGTFSYWTLDSWIPNPLFPIFYGKNAHKTKHGSDSEIFDTEGRFVPEKFEEVFTKYDVGNKGGLTLSEVQTMVKGNRNIMDPTGWFAGWLEWSVSYYLAARETPRGKLLLKDDVRRIIDGTLFYSIANDIKSGKLRRDSIFRAGLVPRVPPRPATTAAGGGGGGGGGGAGEAVSQAAGEAGAKAKQVADQAQAAIRKEQ